MPWMAWADLAELVEQLVDVGGRRGRGWPAAGGCRNWTCSASRRELVDQADGGHQLLFGELLYEPARQRLGLLGDWLVGVQEPALRRRRARPRAVDEGCAAFVGDPGPARG